MKKFFVYCMILFAVPMMAFAQAEPSEQPIYSDEIEARIAAVENTLLPPIVIAGAPVEEISMTLAERMAYHKVPGVSIAVINNGEIEWTRGYGVLEAGGRIPVTSETMFQAASISKPVTAMGVMKLAQDGVLDLDTDVNTYLTSWQIPDSGFTKGRKVTLRRLLTHTAGLGVHGFLGYEVGADLPTTIQILNGESPANNPPIKVFQVPGISAVYSGGGFTVAQLVVEDVTGKPFSQLMQETVLSPIGMMHSAYEQPLLEAHEGSAAVAHTSQGQPYPTKWHVYPELGAAGLWTTSSDLARWGVTLQKAYAGESEAVLSQATAHEILTHQFAEWGIGLVLDGTGAARYFTHSGGNAGFTCNMLVFIENGKGAVVMTNSDTGPQLFTEVFRAIAHVYDWPSVYQPEARAVVEVDPTVFDTFAGDYASGILQVTVRREGDQLMLTLPEVAGGQTVRLYPESQVKYFDVELGIEITFRLNADQTVREVIAFAPNAGEFTFKPVN